MAEPRIRPIGRPKVERDTNGLRKITRKYVVDGIAVSATGDPSIEDDVFLPFGTVDDEYTALTQALGPGYESMVYTDSMGNKTTNAYLVSQEVSPAEEVTQAFLTRIYQELEATPDPVQVGQDEVKVSDAGRLTVQRKFIVRNLGSAGSFTPFKKHYDPERVGKDFIILTIDGEDFKCFLGGVDSKENEVFTEFTEAYFEDAILSQTTEYKNGLNPDHKLEIRTIRAISGSSELSKPSASGGPYGGGAWYLISDREGPGSSDFGQVGKPVSTRVWAKGEGIISENKQVRHNGKLEIVTLKSLGTTTVAGDIGSPSGNGAAFVSVNEDFQESSGHQVFTNTYAAGFGRISESSEDKGLTDIVTEVWITPPGGDHESTISNIFSTRIAENNGYDTHTISGTSTPEGILSVNRLYKNNGALELVTIGKIGSATTITDAGISSNGAAFVLIKESFNESGRYTVYTDTWAAGDGLISEASVTKGDIEIVTEVYIRPNGVAHGSALSNIFSEKVDERDGYDVHTVGGTSEPSGIIDLRRKFSHNGALETVTIRKIGAASVVGDCGVAGNGATFILVSTALDESGQYEIYTDMWAAGDGLISDSSVTKGDIEVVTEVYLRANGAAHGSLLSNIFSEKVVERDGYDMWTVGGTSEPSGIIDLRRQFRQNGHIETVTIRKIGSQSTVMDAGTTATHTGASFVRISQALDESGQFKIYSDVYAAGDGLVTYAEVKKGHITTRTETWLVSNEGDTTETEEPEHDLHNVTSTRDQSQDGYDIWTIVGTLEDSGVISEQRQKKNNEKLIISSVRKIGSAVTSSDIAIAENNETWVKIAWGKDDSGTYVIHTATFVAGKGRISEASEEKGPSGGRIKVITEVWILPTDEDIDNSHTLENVFRRKEDERDGYILHTITGTDEESGVIDVKIQKKNEDKLLIATVRKIGIKPTSSDIGATAPSESSWTEIMTSENNSGSYPIFTTTFLAGFGTIITGVRDTGAVTMTSYTSLDDEPVGGDDHDVSWSDRDGHRVWTWKTYSPSSGYDSESKQWLNKTVYRTTTSSMVDAAPATLATGTNDTSASYSQQVPGIWKKAITTVTAGDPYVIQSTARYNAKGYFQITKVIASLNGYDAVADPEDFAPKNACLMTSSRSYERGWTRDSFTWMALASGSVTTETATYIPWTLPGIAHLQWPFPHAYITYSGPKRISLGVVKTTKLSTSPMTMPAVLQIPSIDVSIHIGFSLKNTSIEQEKTLHNWVYTENKTTMMWTKGYWNGIAIRSGSASIEGKDLFSWTQDAGGNGDPYGAVLAASYSTVFTDGENSIYKLDTTKGSPIPAEV